MKNPIYHSIYIFFLFCVFTSSLTAQNFQNGLYKGDNRFPGILSIRNDTFLIVSINSGSYGYFIFRGVLRNKKIVNLPLEEKLECKLKNLTIEKSDGPAKILIKNIYTEDQTNSNHYPVECSVYEYHESKIKNIRFYNVKNVEGDYSWIIQDTSFDKAIVTIGLEGFRYDNLVINIEKGQVLTFDAYFYPFIRYSETKNIRYKIKNDHLNLIIPNEFIFDPNIVGIKKPLLCFKCIPKSILHIFRKRIEFSLLEDDTSLDGSMKYLLHKQISPLR
jgi:hypothetical protein